MLFKPQSSIALRSGNHAILEDSPASEPRVVGRVIFDSAGPPGHTPFRSSRFMPPADDSEDPQVNLDSFEDPPAQKAAMPVHSLIRDCACPHTPAHLQQHLHAPS